MPAATTLRIAIGDYPHTLPLKRGEIVSPWLKLDFVEVKPMYKGRYLRTVLYSEVTLSYQPYLLRGLALRQRARFGSPLSVQALALRLIVLWSTLWKWRHVLAE